MEFFTTNKMILFGMLFIGLALCDAWPGPLSSVAPVIQYHTQDDLGGYQYAYTGPHLAKTETNLNGITRGGYSYAYTTDAENGFRIHASNSPQNARNDLQPVQDTPEVASAKKRHLEEVKRAKLRNERISSFSYEPFSSSPGYSNNRRVVSENVLGMSRIADRKEDIKNPFLLSQEEAQKIALPKSESSLDFDKKQYFRAQKDAQKFNQQPISSFPISRISPYVLPVIPYKFYHSSLRHTQDSLGQYAYSYAGDTSAKAESRSLDGKTRGYYVYIDANDKLQQVHYIADRDGFRVLATNLPEAK